MFLWAILSATVNLRALRMQLNPHFLFNTLHAISTLIEDEPRTAEEMVLRLSHLLRSILDEENAEISLRKELYFLEDYLAIERVRFGDRLTKIDVGEGLMDCTVPQLVLQPLVENAVRHGIGLHNGRDVIDIRAFADESLLHIEVRNSNSVLDKRGDGEVRAGIGLTNTATRLRTLYREKGSLEVTRLEPSGVAVTMTAHENFAARVGKQECDVSYMAIIADDEPLARKSVRRFLKDYDVEIVEECGDGAETLAALKARNVDLLFLDMDRPALKGLEILADLGEHGMPTTIVLTAHEHFAVQAYDYAVVDYILKPFGKERFERGLVRAMMRIGDAGRTTPPGIEMNAMELLDRARRQKKYPEYIPIPSRHGRISIVRTREIEWVEAEENLLLIHCGSVVHELRETLSNFQERLDPRMFYRVHRSTVVNVRLSMR